MNNCTGRYDVIKKGISILIHTINALKFKPSLTEHMALKNNTVNAFIFQWGWVHDIGTWKNCLFNDLQIIKKSMSIIYR